MPKCLISKGKMKWGILASVCIFMQVVYLCHSHFGAFWKPSRKYFITHKIILPPSSASSPAIAHKSSSRTSSTMNASSGATEAFLHNLFGSSRICLKILFRYIIIVKITYLNSLAVFRLFCPDSPDIVEPLEDGND